MSVHIPILDTHQHLVYPENYPYSWTNDLPALAGKAFRYDDYLKASESTGIGGTIFMEAGVDDPHWREETRFVPTLAQKPGSIIVGMIGNCRPEAPSGFEEYVQSAQSPYLVGLRRFLHTEQDAVAQQPGFVANVALLEKYQLTFDLCVLARQILVAMELAGKCPGVQFILDHCGNPEIAAGKTEPWRQYVTEIARVPNVACKISGVVANCAAGKAGPEDVRPYVEHCLEQFGWDRVVWGSDWPVCNLYSDLRSWVQITRQIISGASESDQRKLLHENAARIYGLKNSSAAN